jgi:hypothetical protein
MFEIVKAGLIDTDDELKELTKRYGQVLIPGEDEDIDLTHWWVIREDGAEMLYVGTPETFTTYVKERNGGIH